MKIKSINTKDGHSIDLRKFTILVGPNNVGKSQTLRDIHSKMNEGINARTTIIKNIEFEKPSTFEEFISGLKVVTDPKNINQHLIGGIRSNLRSGERFSVNLEDFKRQLEAQPNLDFTLGNISRFRVSFLDASSRLVVAQSSNAYNPHTQPPQNLLQALFGSESDLENKLRKAFKDTFGMDIVLDIKVDPIVRTRKWLL